MAISRTVHRLTLAAMLAAIALAPIVTLWLLEPTIRVVAMRQALRERRGPQFWWPTSWRREHNVRARLLQPATLIFVDSPLAEILEFISEYTQVPFVLDEDALKDVRLVPEQIVTISVEQVRLGNSLRLMLDEFDAVCVVEDGMFRITSRQRGDAGPALDYERIYADLLYHAIAEEKISTRLQGSMCLEFSKTPLEEVVDEIRDYVGVNVLVDRRWWNNRAKGKELLTHIHDHTNHPTFENALTTILNEVDGTFIVRDGVIWITGK